MIGFKRITGDDLRLKHETEILAAKSPEIDEVQNSQDEAIAAIYEELVALLFDENGDPAVILTEDNVAEICKKQIDKAVANKVNTAVKKTKAEILEEVQRMIDENAAQAAQDDANVEDEEKVEDDSETPQEGEETPQDEPQDEENNDEEVNGND